MNKNIKEILPTHFTENFTKFKFPAGEHVVLVVMISNPAVCGACRRAEPEFIAAHDIAVRRGVEETIKFMFLHLNNPAWANLDYDKRQRALLLIAPHYMNRYPEFSVLSRDNEGTLFTTQPFETDAEGIFRSAIYCYASIINSIDQSPVTGITSWRSANDNDMDYDEEDFNDEESDFSMILSNFHDMKSLEDPETCGYNGYCGY